MNFTDIKISKAIIDDYFRKLTSSLELDVAIVGAGPAGLTAGYFIAKQGYRVSLFERKLSAGGGMWGGGMMFNTIVVGKGANDILDEFGIRYRRTEDSLYIADAVESVGALIYRSTQAGLRIFNLITVEDLLVKDGKVEGLVINWSPVEMASLPIDPLTVQSRYSVDATGHPLEVVRTLCKKSGVQLFTETGDVLGERSMCADEGEKFVVEKTGEVAPNMFVAGMAACAAFGGPRMGPIFGGMLLSGKKVADIIIKRLKEKK